MFRIKNNTVVKNLPRRGEDIIEDLHNVINEWHNVREFKKLWRKGRSRIEQKELWGTNRQVAGLFWELAQTIFKDLCHVRRESDCGFGFEKFAEGCYYRDLLNHNYEEAKEEWFNLLFGWW